MTQRRKLGRPALRGTTNAREVAHRFGEVVASRGARKPATWVDDLFVAEGDSLRMSDAVAADAIASGVSAWAVEDLAAALPLSKSELLDALNIDRLTLARRMKGKAPLEREEAEAMLRTMEVTTLATDAFGTLDKALAWLGKPHPILGNQSPLAYANNKYGFERVRSILGAIRYGGVV